jgi:hypothetical protein
MQTYLQTFLELIASPFSRMDYVWGIVPLYFGWVLNELTSSKASYTTAIQTGFSFLWAAAHWTWLRTQQDGTSPLGRTSATIVVVVTGVVLAVGLLASWSGIRRRYPRYCSFLGHSRFSNYFMIAIFPMQAGQLEWTYRRLVTICIFAVPLWVGLNLALKPLRRK